jgi:hypothetical protein
MLRFAPKTETRFWKLFRFLLLPIAIGTFVINLVGGIAALCGEDAIYFNNQPVTGLPGFLLSLCYWPLEIVLFTLLATAILFFDRNFKRWKQK